MSEEFFDNVLYYDGVRGRAAAWDGWWRRAGEPFVVRTDRMAVTRSRVRTAVRRGEWWSPLPGTVALVRVDADAADRDEVERRRHALTAVAAGLRHPGHAVAARSAAILHGLPTLGVPVAAELGARNDDGLGRQCRTHSFGARLDDAALMTWFGTPVTTPARTVVDLARHDRRDGLAAADAALHDRLVTRNDLIRELDRAAGWPGVRQARAVIGFADERAESPLESLVRLALHDDGFPAPDLQYRIGPDRVDFCWPERRLVLEADGRGKYRADALWQEKKRSVRLERHGYAVVRVLWSDLGPGWPAFGAHLRTHF